MQQHKDIVNVRATMIGMALQLARAVEVAEH
jgi:hypothetical protein